MKKKSTCVLVTGLPRSGTSALTGMLHTNFGISMGENFAAPVENINSKGFYEDTLFLSVHVAITSTRTFSDMVKVINSGHVFGIQNEIGYKSIVLHNSDRSDIWGVKDTRYLVPEFGLSAIPVIANECDIKILFTDRNFNHVVKSYKNVCNDVSEEEIRKALSTMLEQKEKICNLGLPYFNVSFEQLMNNTKATVKCIADFLNVEFPSSVSFVDRTLVNYI